MSAMPLPACDFQTPVNELVLVDDDKLTLEIVSWITSKGPWQSRLFVDHDDALHHMSTSVPRLLVVDFYMPRMTGLDFVQLLHQRVDLSQTRTFLCSAMPPPDPTLQQFDRLGVKILEKQLICDRTEMTRLLDTHLLPPGGMMPRN